ncbi:MAG: GNAT family N-acetyltransferase [Promethearchaeati archaeon]|nr:MAG: GNAT family N-acetyltransferase [Candidatus Lokiarchaeota archaeon]
MKAEKVQMKDLRKLVNLEKKVFKENAFSKQLMKKLIQSNFIFYKIETEGFFKKLIGFVVIVKDRKDRANLINLLINPKHQGKGYGSFLLGKALELIKSKSNNFIQIILNVSIHNLTAISLYKKFKFRIVKKIENYYRNQEAAYLMKLDIRSENI